MDCLSLHCNHQIEFGVDGERCKQQQVTISRVRKKKRRQVALHCDSCCGLALKRNSKWPGYEASGLEVDQYTVWVLGFVG